MEFRSHAQFDEDTILWAALGNIRDGRYVDVGACHHQNGSISAAFYEQGWSGVTIEPVATMAAEHRRHRPRDWCFASAVGACEGALVTFYEIADTGLSTLHADIAARHQQAGFRVVEVQVATHPLDTLLARAGWHRGQDIHFMTIDVEGSELAVLSSFSLFLWRPWYLVVEATAPLTSTPTYGSWEHLVLAAGYTFDLADEANRFYHAPGRLPLRA